MNIGLVDVDGHNFPNLALMRISSWHKTQGDTVSWWWGWEHYDLVYMSKVFSFTPDFPDPVNADKIIRGGTGYAIRLEDGREVYDKSADEDLAPDIEECRPDYSIYPQYDFAVSMTSRGCPRSCPFCVVSPKYGRESKKVADLDRFYDGQKEIVVLDPNIIACREKRDLLAQYRDCGAYVDFSQGLDIRLINDADLEDLNRMKVRRLHLAWDNPEDELADKFRVFAEAIRIKDPRKMTVYCLVNFNTTIEQDLYRIYKLVELGYTPFVMIYDKEHAGREIKRLARWCNNNWIRKSEPNFSKYTG